MGDTPIDTHFKNVAAIAMMTAYRDLEEMSFEAFIQLARNASELGEKYVPEN